MPLHTGQNGHHKQSNKQVLERMWRKGNPSALLVGLQTIATTMEFVQWYEIFSENKKWNCL